jgi:hypothetical protein
VKHLSGAPLYGRHLVLSTNIRLGWKSLLGSKHYSLIGSFINYKENLEKPVGNIHCSLLSLFINYEETKALSILSQVGK